ncbi:conserved protein of unknown function [Tenacibaculum sp. 190130A14a]|uniref:Lipoprotein n=1 Tax=Tenacibaculum polynesiense TaxID=3137857 RepID=A0ABM9PF04_9FLAO
MKKVSTLIIAIFLSSMLTSCTDNDELVKEEKPLELKTEFKTQLESCCDEEEDIIPPPPPPKKINL